MEAFALILIILSFAAIGICVIEFDEFLVHFFISLIIIAFIIIGCGILCDYYSKPTPEPIDVYRDKTTLQITYQDSIPIDTIVVFKPEFIK